MGLFSVQPQTELSTHQTLALSVITFSLFFPPISSLYVNKANYTLPPVRIKRNENNYRTGWHSTDHSCKQVEVEINPLLVP